jgi:hypothetical protein
LASISYKLTTSKAKMNTPEDVKDLLERLLEAGEVGKKANKELNSILRKDKENFLLLAQSLECSDCEDLLKEFLQNDKDSLQTLGLELMRRMRRPTLPLLEPVADISRLPGAKEVLLRFPHAALKKELHSLIKSKNEEESVVGLELARYLGASAEEYTPLIAEVFAQDLRPKSSRAAVHTLAALAPKEDHPKLLSNALDHWNEEVRKDVRRYLEKVDFPVRASIWEGHPFSEDLRIQLQRLGFSPKAKFEITEDRPWPALSFDWGGEDKEKPKAMPLSAAIWAFLRSLNQPDYHLYIVWGSSEDSQTFYFSNEPSIYVVDHKGTQRFMYVIGDGSIGCFATLDLNDSSNDPAVYYIERWAGHKDGTWRVSFSLSSYLKQLGSRSAK